MDTPAYQVIARKYRPQTFSSIVGQESIVTTLKNALRFKRLAHAYLFCGCRGTGKTTLARVFAKALNCQNLSSDFEPCNACFSCTDITLGKSLDVLEIDGASNRGIDDIRQINETVGYTPAAGNYKIYIIDEVHMLTKEAFNALLKTLEEPPSHVKFFFATTEPHKILPTILSRCQRFDLNRIAFEMLKEKLFWITQDLNVPCEEEVLSLVANLAEGSLRDAESLLDQIICYADQPITLANVSTTLGIMPRSVFLALDKAFHEQNFSYAFELSSTIFSSGKDLIHFLDHLVEHFRALLKLKWDPSFSFPSAKLKQQYAQSAQLYTEEQCIYILDYLIQSQQHINKTPFKRVHLEMLLLHVIRSKYRLTLPALVKRLQELENRLQSNSQESVIPIKSETTAPSVDIALAPIDPVTPTLVQPIPLIQEEEMTRLNQERELPSTPLKADIPRLLNTSSFKTETTPSKSTPLPQEEEITPLTQERELPNTPLVENTPLILNEPSLDELLINKIQNKINTLPKEEPSVLPSLILSKKEWENKAIASEPSSTPTHVDLSLESKDSSDSSQINSKDTSPQGCHYDTLIRFAAVELEGVIKNSTK